MELDVQLAPEIERKPFNISTISITIYSYYIKNHKKDNTTLFYIIYENLSEVIDNLFKDYTQITEIIIVYNDFRKKAIIPNEVID